MKYIILAFIAITLAAGQLPQTPEALGERLFFDPILSLDSTISCASCHQPSFGFADTSTVSTGILGRKGHRNSPSVTNMAARSHFFFDGRAATLEQQVLMPIQDSVEMGISLAAVEKRLRLHPEYSRAFETLYGRPANATDLANALSAFVRTLETANSAFDRYMHDGPNPMSDAAIRGRRIFMKKGKCFDCHFSPDFTGDEFRNIGLYNGQKYNDTGRFAITKDSADLGRFKVPGLRNVAATPPYMHDGSFATLEMVIDYYDEPSKFIPDAINRDSLLQHPLNLTADEKADLKAFLEALTDERFVK